MSPKRRKPMPMKEGLRLRLVFRNETADEIDLQAEPDMHPVGIGGGKLGVLEFMGGELPVEIEITLVDGNLLVEEIGPPYVAQIETFDLEDDEHDPQGPA